MKKKKKNSSLWMSTERCPQYIITRKKSAYRIVSKIGSHLYVMDLEESMEEYKANCYYYLIGKTG